MNRNIDKTGKAAKKGRKADAAELAERLRANLRRRKQQQQARRTGSDGGANDGA